MTIYIIGWVLLALAFVISLFNIIEMLERKRKVWILPILVVVGVLLVLCAAQQPRLDKYYEIENPHSYQELFPEAYKEGFENGYKRAIEEAVLVETTDTGYIISFNGKDNVYVYNNN